MRNGAELQWNISRAEPEGLPLALSGTYFHEKLMGQLQFEVYSPCVLIITRMAKCRCWRMRVKSVLVRPPADLLDERYFKKINPDC